MLAVLGDETTLRLDYDEGIRMLQVHPLLCPLRLYWNSLLCLALRHQLLRLNLPVIRH
jgi:hypothetical protein